MSLGWMDLSGALRSSLEAGAALTPDLLFFKSILDRWDLRAAQRLAEDGGWSSLDDDSPPPSPRRKVQSPQ